jgi:hypothetical protein
LGVIGGGGEIRWGRLLDILPAGERVSLTLHPELQIAGNLPPHIPVAKVERTKAPRPGVLLATEIGPYLRITSENSILLEMVWEQLRGAEHHTWSEIVKSARVPRRVDLAEATARDLLRLHGEQTRRLGELSQLLTACAVY